MRKDPQKYSVWLEGWYHRRDRESVGVIRTLGGLRLVQPPERIAADERRHAVEATIVRVMKARNQLTHAQLTAEVTEMLLPRFKPDPKGIKRRIEDLIERDYIERDEEQPELYNYLA